jgi:hypothetical protein
MIQEAFDFHLEGMHAAGLPIPSPTSVSDYIGAGIQGIICLLVSIAACIYTARQYRDDEDKQRSSHTIGVLAAIVLVIHAVQLPQNYQAQQNSYEIIENARETSKRLAAENELLPQ